MSRVDKSLRAYRTIGEIAEKLGVEKHVLRSWEKLFPGVGASRRLAGRRYYSNEDYERICFIYRKLRKEGYSAEGVRKLLSGGRNFGDTGEDLGRNGKETEGRRARELLGEIEELRKRLVLM